MVFAVDHEHATIELPPRYQGWPQLSQPPEFVAHERGFIEEHNRHRYFDLAQHAHIGSRMRHTPLTLALKGRGLQHGRCCLTTLPLSGNMHRHPPRIGSGLPLFPVAGDRQGSLIAGGPGRQAVRWRQRMFSRLAAFCTEASICPKVSPATWSPRSFQDRSAAKARAKI